MFVLAEMKDTVRIKPWHFGVDLREAIANKLNKKLANKVVHNVGLCIVLHDITSIGDSYLFPGDGSSHTPGSEGRFTDDEHITSVLVKFRFVVFRPFIDEVLTGRIRSCNHEGVQVSMEFFDDIIIPYEYLQQASKFDEDEQLWVWEYTTDEGGHDLFMDINEEIRFRVVDELFTDLSPAGPEMTGDMKNTDEVDSKRSPYTITASISEPGLGLKSWWAG